MTMTSEPPITATPALEASMLFRDLADHLSLNPHLVPVFVNPAGFESLPDLQLYATGGETRWALLAWADSLSVTAFRVQRI